jgi:Domain of Unknown Function (DUF1080)
MRFTAICVFLTVVGSARADDAADGFVPVFNGKNLDGWTERQVKKGQEGRWSVHDGILKAKAGSGWLGTEKMYGDFVLRVEWKIAVDGNSGVFFRVPSGEFKESPSTTGFEIQILDDNGPKYKGKLQPYQYSGGLYHFQAPTKAMFKGAGEWNSYELTVKGDAISLVYNGEKVIEADISKNDEMKKRPRKGYIGLQNHGSEVEFRNVAIKVLD